MQSENNGISTPRNSVGNVYLQTNQEFNNIIHYKRLEDGRLVESARFPTGGKGSGIYKPITGQESAPNAFEGVGSVLLTVDSRFLFVTNGGDNSVSSFEVGADGALVLLDNQPTGQTVHGRSGTAKSLTYAEDTQTLYVGHSFGPDHIRMFSVNDGKLTAKHQFRSVNTANKTDRVATQILLTPDRRFLLANVLFDRRPGFNPDNTPNFRMSNSVDSDGLAIFAVNSDGSLGEANFVDAGGAGSFVTAFLNRSSTTFINGYAASDGLAMGRIDTGGNVTFSPIVPIDNRMGTPSELCWAAITPDDQQVFATVVGYSRVTSYKIINGVRLEIAQDPAAPAVPGDGTYKALDGLASSTPVDTWISPDGKCFYQIYPNASVLIAYEIHPDGRLTEFDRYEIPYNSPQGLAGF